MSATPVIEARGLTKRFGSLVAVESLDLAVAPGEIYGLLGPNGAGKTTTIRALLGFLNPTSGQAQLFGVSPRDFRIRRRVGYVSGDVIFDRGQRVWNLLGWYANLRGGVSQRRIDDLCAELGLDQTRKIGELSTGNRQKVAIVQSLMHDPDILILDEPTSGLDPLLQRSVLKLIREQQSAGAAVLYSSHLLNEVENIADRVGILRRGVLVREDTMANLREVARHRLELRFATDIPPDLFGGLDGVSAVEVTDRIAHLVVDGSVAALVRRVAEYDVDRIVSHDEDLEDIFFTYYQDGENSA